ncbi:hypothetical protein F3Y22_tig00110330pilonHSYRG00091 [Hibiscus syriacus]|uniref:Uncharacterized protein n=1 Tax=Hibiscus syriacus TaxID=106335 RepID=A0A6A3B2D0_HIBSY|nr:hypothetical protein F3Y22_tig00110330pilonHSYRG00091 [Hibiscus syriacus]
MATFTAIAFDRLLEPGASRPVENSSSTLKPPIHPKPTTNCKMERCSWTSVKRKANRPQISPSPYATPEATPLPDSPSSFCPSPYIINHKRRGPSLSKSFSEANVSSLEKILEEDEINGKANLLMNEVYTNGFLDGEVRSSQINNGLLMDAVQKVGPLNLDICSDSEDFFDLNESMSVTSNTETIRRDIEAELREMRLSLLTEIEKRKQTEEALNKMQSNWQRIGQKLGDVGLSLHEDLLNATEDELVNQAEELRQQVCAARFVSLSVGRGITRAEMEMEMEAQIESKNFEIARLLDRLHYYETVNREMYQRNQEAIEVARRDRQRKKRRQRWVWGFVATAITLGTAVLAWSYLPTGKGSSSDSISKSSDDNPTAK